MTDDFLCEKQVEEIIPNGYEDFLSFLLEENIQI